MNISQGERGGNGDNLGVVNQWFLFAAPLSTVGCSPRHAPENLPAAGRVGVARQEESRCGAIEYGLIAAGIYLTVIAIVNDLGSTLNSG